MTNNEYELAKEIAEFKRVNRRSYLDIGKRWNIDPDKAKELVHSYKKGKKYEVPETFTSDDDQPLHIVTDGFLWISDLHCPYHSKIMLDRALTILRTYFPHIGTIIFGGDLFDNAAVSDHPHTGLTANMNQVIDIGGDVLRAIMDSCTRLVILSGNHDQWVERKLDAPFDLRHLINAALKNDRPDCEMIITNLDYVYVNDDYIVGHPSDYSAKGGQTPAFIADAYHKHVITGHNHVAGYQMSVSGLHWGIDSGSMTNPDDHYYVRRRLSKRAKWTMGFVVVDHGYPYLFNDKMTDWKSLGL